MKALRTSIRSLLLYLADFVSPCQDDLSHLQLLQYFEKIARTVDKDYLNGHVVKPSLQKEVETLGFHLIKDHFYSPIPSLNSVKNQPKNTPTFLDTLGLTGPDQFDALFEKVISHSDNLEHLPRSCESGFYWNNPMFPPLDALTYYGLICELKPKRIIEIGCGFSTEIALRASEQANGVSIECIEPYPSERFKSLIPKVSRFSQSLIQNIPVEYFTTLESGDFLFIDTAHVTKRDSDVNYIIFNILPALKPGVIVHIHDIFLPFDYPESWLQEIGIMWNEQYLILAMLMAKGKFKPILLNYYLGKRHITDLSKRLLKFDIWNLTENLGNAQGASLWFEITP
jgi:hypothetical protein